MIAALAAHRIIVVLRHWSTKTRNAAVSAGALVCLLAAAASEGPARLAGRVVDENNAAVPGAQITLKDAGGAVVQHAGTDPTGAFAVTAAGPGEYRISAECQGFFRIENRVVRLAGGDNEIVLTLNEAREVFERLEVSYSPKPIELDRTTPEETLTNTQLLEVPYPSTNTLRSAMRAIPGVVHDTQGRLHLNGGTEEQVLYTLDGFEINDPLSGRFESRMSVEAVRSMEVTPLNPAEFGKGSAGVLAIKTSTGDDRFRYSATNFVPGVDFRKGLYVGGWTPRFNLSGPIARGRAWFSDGLDIQYDKNVIEDLPKGADRTTSWRASNLLRSQVNLGPSNILTTGLLTSFWDAPHQDLGALKPIETTLDRRSRQYFFNLKDQVYFRHGALIEVGYAATRTSDRSIPQGHGLLLLTPDGNRGNAFVDARLNASRDQILANVFLPSFSAAGGHQIKAGVDLDFLNYWQNTSRTGYEFWRANYTLARKTVFGGSGRLTRNNTEQAVYLQDSWKPRPSVLLEAGLRQDWDRLVGRLNWSPRIGASWSPPGLESTKVSGGWGVVYDQSNLRLFSRPLDQYQLTTHYDETGSVLYGPAISLFTIGGGLRSPRYDMWNFGVDQRFAHDVYASVNVLRKRGKDGFTYLNTLSGAPPLEANVRGFGVDEFDAIYRLTNSRRDVYDAVQLSVRQTFHKQYEWMASYTRSRARSNAVLDPAADDPLLVTSNAGPMAWDTPNRLVSWGYLPARWPNWAVAYLLEWRTGFPFSVYDSSGQITGEVNSRRFPGFFELSPFLERRFTFHGNRWALRFGFINVTNRPNPNVVNADTSSPTFLYMYGGQGRAFNVRFRWLGK